MSDYSGYDVADNVRRKMNNTGDVVETVGPHKNVKSYSSKPGQLAGWQQTELEAKRQARLNKMQPVKYFSQEEIAKYQPVESKKKHHTKPKPKHQVELMKDDQFKDMMADLNKKAEAQAQPVLPTLPVETAGDVKSQIEHLESLGFTAEQIVAILKMKQAS